MDFDAWTVVLLELRDDAPVLDDAAADALQDAHLDFLAGLHEQGYLLAAGPAGDPEGAIRGVSILNVPPERALELKSADPAVVAGRFRLRVMPWQVPAGAVHFTPTRFPHSVADVRA
ncbi:YciI family protein [Xylanimonas sp. McL0601]|uniref:YciI family protein n=1 Tax=Xylanimonas sp. McL0601 TaxID=3414739 RepID=UPI003CF42146